MATRSMATLRDGIHTGIPRSMTDLRKNIWLSDPGAYPVAVVVTFACGMCFTYMGYCCVANPDVRIGFGRRQQIIRDWD